MADDSSDDEGLQNRAVKRYRASLELDDSSSDEEDVPLRSRLSKACAKTPRTQSELKHAPCTVDGAPLPTTMPVEEGDLIDAERVPFAKLRDFRWQRAEELGIKAYYIAHDTTLCEIVRRVPTNLDELSEVPGMGRTFDLETGEYAYGERVKKHGAGLCAVLSPHVEELRRAHEAYQTASGVALGSLTASQVPLSHSQASLHS